jgi:DNA-binding beta-propeller fold protein YncE
VGKEKVNMAGGVLRSLRKQPGSGLFVTLILASVIVGEGCGSSKTISVTVSPKTATVKLQSTQQFAYSITPSSDTAGVKWYVNDTLSGNSTIGTIDTTGKYTAPSSSSTSFTVTIKAISNTDTSKYDTATLTVSTGATVTVFPTSTVTIAEGETYQFTDTVTNLVNANSPTTVDWYVDGTNGGTNANGTITSSGLYTAPASAGTHVIKAVLQSDSSSYGQTSVNVVSPEGASVTDVYPCDSGSSQLYGCSLPQGALFEDIYLYGSNFRSSSSVRANSTPIETSFISTNLLRARLTAADLAKADTSSGTGTLFIDVTQNGPSGADVSQAIDVPVSRVPPTLIASTPDSVVQGGGALSVAFDGGFFTSATSADFNGIPQSSTVQNSRQLLVSIDPSNFATSGLYPIAVRTSTQPQIAATNLAVRPDISQGTSPTPLTTQPVKGTSPSAIAINSATGLAVVANSGSNNITLFDLTASIPTAIGPYAVGKTPTGVAVDSLRNLVFVANSGDNSLQILDVCASRQQETCMSGALPASAKTVATISFGTQGSSGTSSSPVLDAVQPYSVGLNPLTGKALVVFQGSSYVDVIDYSNFVANAANPDVTKIKVQRGQIPTRGTFPRIAVEPRLNWAFVTPGGDGNGAVVDLGANGQQIVSLIAAPSSSGAVRKSGTVTITTTSNHNLTVGEYVTVSGVNDTSFDGYFQIATVPASNSFTFSQSGSDNDTNPSGNGSVSAAAPLATINIDKDVRGIGINTQTEMALLCNPNSVSQTLMSLLDQTTSLISGANGASIPASDCAMNPLTDVAVTVNSQSNTFSIIDIQNSFIQSQFLIGRNPSAVAVDAPLNLAVAVNSTDATITIIPLGNIRSSVARPQPQVMQLSPLKTLTSTSDETITLVGGGFVSGAVVRINSTPLVTQFVSSRVLTANLPSAKLASPVHFVVDVQNPDGNISNVNDFYVMKAVSVGTTPRGVAIDRERNVAVVTNTSGAGGDGSLGSVSVVDLGSFTEKYRITVGKSPQGVGLSSLAGRAAVANTDDDTVSIISLDTGTLASTVSIAVSSNNSAAGTKPVGLAVHPGTGQVVVAGNNASQVSFFDIGSPATPSTLDVDIGPNAPAIDPTRNIAAVAEGASDKVVIIDLASKQILARITGIAFPTGALYDPDSDTFMVASSTTNNVYSFHVDPTAGIYATPKAYSVGFNPTSLDYNYRTSTLVTANTLSQTLSVLDFLTGKVKAVIPLSVSQQFGVAIDPSTNRAVVVDQNNNRILIVPLPR